MENEKKPRKVQKGKCTMYTRRSNNWIWIVVLIVLVLLTLLFALFLLRYTAPSVPPVAQSAPAQQTSQVSPTQPVSSTVATSVSSYPLAGQVYSSPQGSEYNAVWTLDGRLWQPQLPAGNLRKAHTVGITIEEGSYAFDGVECQLFVDPSRNGAGASNPVTAAFGNDLHFTVKTADGGQAWALVQCRGNASSGFQIRSLGK